SARSWPLSPFEVRATQCQHPVLHPACDFERVGLAASEQFRRVAWIAYFTPNGVGASASRNDYASSGSIVDTQLSSFLMSCVFGNSTWRRTSSAFKYFSAACRQWTR